MTPATTPNVQCRQLFPTVLVDDIKAAADFYIKRLGFQEGFIWGDPPTFAGLRLGDTTLHLQQGMSYITGRSAVGFLIGNADELYDFHRANNVEILEPIDDRPYGWRDYSVKDPYGNALIFGHYIYNQGPAIKIERVDVPLRLEKRLAAVLEDLAKHKRMSINSCIEETLLHTFERVGDTVASPHTIDTLNYIQELKKKHGIDYDSHGSYRFEEEPEA
jgi:uncharacterized glyoxalase superfamily protein PhnB